MGKIRQILCAVDGSEPSLHAAAWAGKLAACAGARLTLLHVADVTSTAEVVGLARGERVRVGEVLRERGRATLQRARARVPTALDVDEVVEVGDPVHVIVDWARAHDVDAVVVGSHGHGALGSVLLGSVSERVMRRASCPVTVVH